MEFDPMSMGGVFNEGSAFAGLDGKEAIPNWSMERLSDPNAGRIGVPNATNNTMNNKGAEMMDQRMERFMMQREEYNKQMNNQGQRGPPLPPPM